MKFKIKDSLVLLFLLISIISQNEISADIQNSQYPYIVTDGTGTYVYGLWTKNDGTNDIIQTTGSSTNGLVWSDPINLSASGQNALTPCFTVDATEKNVYAIWVRANGTNDIIQFSVSLDFAVNWSTPQDLSAIGQDASIPHMITDFIGDDVYAIWVRTNGTNDIIQFSKSADFGSTFSSPVDLSVVGQNAMTPQIATNFNENCVCAIWPRSNGTNDIIQFKHSLDYGINWNSTIDLSEIGQDAREPRVITKGDSIYAVWARQENGIYRANLRSSTDRGDTFSETLEISPNTFSVNTPRIVTSNDVKYVYVVWYMSNGRYTDAHVVVSNDYGVTFTAPYVLNQYGQNCRNTDIAIDTNGENIYVIWVRSNGYYDIVQIGKSSDYGATWTTFGMDLSLTGESAKNPRIATNQSGSKVYVSWARSDGTKDVIQEVQSADYGVTFSVPKVVSN
ncbi:MAG: hypothetical protein K1060chlam3_00004 [Candidatus Anoxychlamydiales bacterium]|nr:hypothetical protein [Candidatus Anoxychlamydiales bacterium]